MLSSLEGKYPRIHSLAVVVRNREKALTGGDCDVALMSETEISGFWSQGKLCDFTTVGRPVMSFFTGFYTGRDLAVPVNHVVSRILRSGEWLKIEGDLLPASICPAHNKDESREEDVEQLSAS